VKVSAVVTVIEAGVMLNVLLVVPLMVMPGLLMGGRADRAVAVIRHRRRGGEIESGDAL
jgi:hypothetical protein